MCVCVPVRTVFAQPIKVYDLGLLAPFLFLERHTALPNRASDSVKGCSVLR